MNSKYHFIVVPGIMGSYLNKEGKTIWIPRSLGALSELRKTQGHLEDGVTPEGIVKKILLRPIFDRLLRHFGSQYSFEACPYDWRRPIESQAYRLAECIERVSGKEIVVVAHSMGGLLAKYCLLEDERLRKRVKFLFTLGTPWLGAPEAFVQINKGLQLEFPLLSLFSGPLTKKVVKSCPSVFQLLPSRPYFGKPFPDYYITEVGSGPVSYDGSKLIADDLSSSPRYFTNFNEGGIQKWAQQPLKDTIHFSIIGYGQPTIMEIGLEGSNRVSPLRIESGDGTVPVKSAAWAESIGATNRYIRSSHQGLPAEPEIMEFIDGVISAENPMQVKIQGVSETALPVPFEQIIAHCPVDVVVQGFRPGKKAAILGDYIINEFEDVSIMTLPDDGKIITFPARAGYKVRFFGRGNGTMDLIRSCFCNGDVQEFALYRKVTVNRGDIMELNAGDDKCLMVLRENDTKVYSIKPTTTNSAVLYDKEGPVITVMANEIEIEDENPVWYGKATKTLTVQCMAVDQVDGTNLRYFNWSYDGINWSNVKGPIELSKNQVTRIMLAACDNANNETKRLITIGWEANDPTLELREDEAEYGKRLHISTRSLAPSSINISVNGTEFSPAEWSTSLDFTSPGSYTVCCSAKSVAGNSSQTYDRTITVPSRIHRRFAGEFKTAAYSGNNLSTFLENNNVAMLVIDGVPFSPRQKIPIGRKLLVAASVWSPISGELDDMQFEVDIPIKVDWISPKLSKRIRYTRKDQFSVRFRLSGQTFGQSIPWDERLKMTIRSTGERDIELFPEWVPEIGAYTANISFGELTPAVWNIDISSGPVSLGSQEFTVVG